MMRISLTFLVIFFLTNCANHSIKDFDAYAPAPALRSDFIDKKKVKKKHSVIAVLPFEITENEIAKKAGLGNAVVKNIEQMISKNKLVKFADRKAIKKFAKEVSLSEMAETGSYQGPAIADYVVSGEIIDAGLTYEFIAARSKIDVKNQSYQRIAPKHKYIADFNASLKIYRLPSLEVVEIIPLQARKIRIDDAAEDASLFSSKIEVSMVKKEDNQLLRATAKKAVESQGEIIKNIFSALRKGYILEKRIKDKKTIFKVNLGKKNGIAKGDKVKIYAKFKSENPLTEEEEIETIKIADGVISDQITSHNSWIIVKDAKNSEKIKIGNEVNIVYKDSFMKKNASKIGSAAIIGGAILLEIMNQKNVK